MMSSATVFIWYPKGRDLGHASMYIGDLSNAALLQDGLMHPNREERLEHYRSMNTQSLRSKPQNLNYVSWWPSIGVTFPRCAAPSKLALDLRKDVQQEQREPDVIYRLFGLSYEQMVVCWAGIQRKYIQQQASYVLTSKNCATIVARVLKAGGIGENQGITLLDLHKTTWKPRDVAVLCNKMRDANKATKAKSEDYRTKSSSLMWVLAGFR